jgi:cell wall-associated NlpC family hydrolase
MAQGGLTMGEAKTEFHWTVARGIVFATCLTGGWIVGASPARAQATPGAQTKAQAVPAAQARVQAAPSEQAPAPGFRLLSAKEERSIVVAAKDRDQTERDAQDCSHFVHQTYLDAGFEYPYANSFELYAGNENFQRVRHPRAGDLIVWPGHVGIVLDPMEHTFYSLVSTGLEAQDYLGTYWKARGRPRFYRYKVEKAEMLTAVRAPVAPRAGNSKKTSDAATLVEDRSPVGASDSNRPPKTISEQTRVVNGPAAAVDESKTFEIPRSMAIATGSKQPTSREVADAIWDLTNASGEILRSDDPTALALPVVIFDGFQVERLEIKRNHGWARLQIDSRATIAGGEASYKRRSEKVRWELRKTESGWEAIAPTDRTYVPNDVAVRNLAAQLARLTEGDGSAAHQETALRQESQLANLLSGLLDSKAGVSSTSRKPLKRSQPAGGGEKSEKQARSGGPS